MRAHKKLHFSGSLLSVTVWERFPPCLFSGFSFLRLFRYDKKHSIFFPLVVQNRFKELILLLFEQKWIGFELALLQYISVKLNCISLSQKLMFNDNQQWISLITQFNQDVLKIPISVFRKCNFIIDFTERAVEQTNIFSTMGHNKRNYFTLMITAFPEEEAVPSSCDILKSTPVSSILWRWALF